MTLNPCIIRHLVAVDLFAGGGGASEGIRRASGVEPVVAVNHNPHAIEMHTLNHPGTIHFQQSVYDVAPGECVPGRQVDLLWASPDCTHFSRAKGGKPKKKEIRALAWVVVKWAEAIAPTVLIVENVAEFRTWGPLDENGQPDKARKGETFDAWIRALQGLGYQVEHRVLAACDYDTPTTRKRLFVVARRDGQPIRWPEPTNGPGRSKPFRTAAECIDWSIPCPSIFTRKKPLADATQRRIAEGVRRYVLEAERPFLVNLTHGGRLENLDQPFKTITGANRGEKALVVPYVAQTSHQSSDGGKIRAVTEPVSTVVTKAEHLLVVPSIINTRNGERKGQAPRVRSVEQPHTTITAQGSQGGLVAAFLAKHNRGATGQPLSEPVHTITGKDTKAVVAAHLAKSETGNMQAVAALLIKYYGAGGQQQTLEEPLHTIVSKARFGLVTVDIDGEEYAVTDIGMRMLQPRELARAQGFGDDYQLIGTKTQRVARIGNSVCPPLAQALVEAQFGGSGCPDLPAHPDQVPLFGHRFEAAK